MSTTTKWIRKISLIICMVTAALFCAVCWWGVALWEIGGLRPMIVPAVGFTGVYIWFIGVEIWGALTGYKKTLSTRYDHFMQQNPKFAVIGLVGLALFLVSMVSLTIHLAVYW